MLTKGNLFELLSKSFNDGKSILDQRKQFRSAVHSHLRSKYSLSEVSEEKLTKFSETYTNKICTLLRQFRNRPPELLNSKRHTTFFNNCIKTELKTDPGKSAQLPAIAQPPSMATQTVHDGKTVSWLRHLAKKRKLEDNPELIQPKSKRQKERDSKEVRDGAVEPDSIHLASAQEFGKKGHWDAYHVVKLLAENPEKFGPFLRDACKRIDMEQFPKMSSERMLSTVLHKSISG